MFNVNAILDTADLRDLVEKAGGRIERGRSVCPLHGGHDHTAFAIYHNEGRDMWTCFSGDCGTGDAIDFVQKWRGLDFKQACEFLGGNVQADPVEMERLARERLARAEADLREKQERYEAALRELQVAQKHLIYHNTMGTWARDMWLARGLDEGMQDFFTLGGCEDFTVNGDYHTPTLTIPILDENRGLLNIQHRLVNPPNPKDKYRPERVGLGSPPFLAIPEMGFYGELILVMEGAVKAMVTWTKISGIDIQTVGVSGRSNFKKLIEPLQGKNVVVIPDPGAEKDAWEFARSIRGKYIAFPAKVDDFLNETRTSSNDFYSIIKQARRA